MYKTRKGVEISLLTSKTRVTPLKQLRIPQLELMGAKIFAQLVDSVKRALCDQLAFKEIVLWTDSITVLYWLQSH